MSRTILKLVGFAKDAQGHGSNSKDGAVPPLKWNVGSAYVDNGRRIAKVHKAVSHGGSRFKITERPGGAAVLEHFDKGSRTGHELAPTNPEDRNFNGYHKSVDAAKEHAYRFHKMLHENDN